jgi:hypothetical protein
VHQSSSQAKKGPSKPSSSALPHAPEAGLSLPPCLVHDQGCRHAEIEAVHEAYHGHPHTHVCQGHGFGTHTCTGTGAAEGRRHEQGLQAR